MIKTIFITLNALEIANGYKEATEIIYKELKNKKNFMNSFVTNGVFTTELYLKIILKTQDKKLKNIHKLDALYKLIDQDTKEELEKKYNLLDTKTTLPEVLNRYKDSFENFRYSYEGYNRDGTINKEKIGLYANPKEILNILHIFYEYCNKNCKEVNFCDRDTIKYNNRK